MIATAAGKRWWEERWFVGLVVGAMALPLLYPQTPPLTDLFAHMGRYTVQLELDRSPALQRFYGFEWALIGNLGADLLVVPLSASLGLEPAVKLIVIAVPVTGAIGLFWLSHEVHGAPTPTIMWAAPFLFGNPFNFGFLNFVLGMSLVLNALALWIRLGKHNWPGLRAIVFVPVALVIWITHSAAWAVLCLVCFASAFVERREHSCARSLRHAVLNSATLALPLLLIAFAPRDTTEAAWQFPDLANKYLMFQMALRDRWQAFDVLSVFAVAGLIVVLARSAAFGGDRRLLAAAAILFAAFVITPAKLLGSAYVDMRLIPYAIILALIAFAPRRSAPPRVVVALALTGLLFLCARLGGNTLSYLRYDQLHRGSLAAVDRVPRGGRVLTLVGRPDDVPWFTDRREHIASMLIVRRHAFANDQFDGIGAQLLTIRKADAPGFVYDGSQLVRPNGSPVNKWRTIDQSLSKFPRAAFDYLWLIGPPPFDASLIGDLRAVWRNGDQTLYRVLGAGPLSREQRK